MIANQLVQRMAVAYGWPSDAAGVAWYLRQIGQAGEMTLIPPSGAQFKRVDALLWTRRCSERRAWSRSVRTELCAASSLERLDGLDRLQRHA